MSEVKVTIHALQIILQGASLCHIFFFSSNLVLNSCAHGPLGQCWVDNHEDLAVTGFCYTESEAILQEVAEATVTSKQDSSGQAGLLKGI